MEQSSSQPVTRQPTPLQLSIAQASERSLGMFAFGATVGLFWGAFRGTGPLWTYPLHIGSNFAFVSLPCFAVREAIGNKLNNDPLASALSGAIGGGLVMYVYTGIRGVPKAMVGFSLVGLAMERANQAFLDYKAKKRDEILQSRQGSAAGPDQAA